ncbi:flagellar basal body rod protein FlgB [Rhodocista pekingensis]|uniref:Flagellar basal body rod protein FlgB n=1 Tax=Rhodocista pekingensis TaxID=201185 RepID=A0ABW2KZ32_9PROT
MDLAAIGLFHLASRRMDYLGARHQVIAENVANANSPGYRAKDLKAFDFQSAMQSAAVRPSLTDPAHLAGLREARDFKEDRQAAAYEMAPDGNGVVLEEQMMKAAEVRQAYDLAAGLFQKHVGMLRQAFTGR